MIAVLTALWGRVQTYVLAVAGILVAVLLIFQRGKSSGEANAKEEQRKVDDAARKRMEDVKHADSAATVDKLRRGRF